MTGIASGRQILHVSLLFNLDGDPVVLFVGFMNEQMIQSSALHMGFQYGM